MQGNHSPFSLKIVESFILAQTLLENTTTSNVLIMRMNHDINILHATFISENLMVYIFSNFTLPIIKTWPF